METITYSKMLRVWLICIIIFIVVHVECFLPNHYYQYQTNNMNRIYHRSSSITSNSYHNNDRLFVTNNMNDNDLSTEQEHHQNIPGIWKIKFSNNVTCLPFFRRYMIDTKQQQKEDDNDDDEIIFRFDDNGTFRQCNEGYKEGCWMLGQWKLIIINIDNNNKENKEEKHRTRIVIALDRQYYGPSYDIALDGSIQQQKDNRINGNVLIGKFMYPKKHPLFFDNDTNDLIVLSEIQGTFIMEQVIRFNAFNTKNTITTPNEMKSTSTIDITQQCNIEVSSFYDRIFFMTIEPLKLSLSSTKTTIERNKFSEMKNRNDPRITRYNDAKDQNSFYNDIDIDDDTFRTMKILFHKNHTFQANGYNNILRGRYGVEQQKHLYDIDNNTNIIMELWFQVSIFGSGRSAPGSVYSEGLNVNQHDKCLYKGEIMIQNEEDKSKMYNNNNVNARRIYVSGHVYIGSNLGSDARMEPIHKFLLTEIINDNDNNISNNQETTTTARTSSSPPTNSDTSTSTRSVFE